MESSSWPAFFQGGANLLGRDVLDAWIPEAAVRFLDFHSRRPELRLLDWHDLRLSLATHSYGVSVSPLNFAKNLGEFGFCLKDADLGHLWLPLD
jgi:hypothetical protein